MDDFHREKERIGDRPRLRKEEPPRNGRRGKIDPSFQFAGRRASPRTARLVEARVGFA
jgi:hypothetical protein